MADANVYQHFRGSEHPFLDAITSWLEQVEMQYAPYLTNFLDPRQAYILENLTKQNADLKVQFNGGYLNAERKRALIYPDYYQPNDQDFDFQLYEIIYPVKFATLTHPQILGSLMSVGIKRDYFGDIITDGVRWQIFLATETENYVQTQLEKIGKIAVRLEPRHYLDLIIPDNVWEEEQTTASSLRLDTVISAVYNISRTRSKKLIESDLVKVNWSVENKVDFEVKILDIISVRGFGRVRIDSLGGKTHKDRYRIFLSIIRNN